MKPFALRLLSALLIAVPTGLTFGSDAGAVPGAARDAAQQHTLADEIEKDAFAFAVFGDTPYSAHERAELPKMLQAMGERDIAFALHVGDIKSGNSPCSDEVYLDRRRLFDAFVRPLIYVPGDNEWTDCHRPSAGGHDPGERLQRLRTLFFAAPESFGQRRIALERQAAGTDHPALPENARWQKGRVLFVTLNIPGSDNGIVDEARPAVEFLTRERGNRAWLSEAFAIAREARLAAVVIGIQANPGFEEDARGKPKTAYRDFLQQLRMLTRAFSGQVLLVHGDTHRQRIDKPLIDPENGTVLQNFTRVETFGAPFMGWIEVVFQPKKAGFAFTVYRWPAEPPLP